MNALIALAAAGTLLAGGAASPETVTKPRQASVVGSAQIRFHYVPDDDIRFHFNAHAAPFTRPTPQAPSGLLRGGFTVRHADVPLPR